MTGGAEGECGEHRDAVIIQPTTTTTVDVVLLGREKSDGLHNTLIVFRGYLFLFGSQLIYYFSPT